LSNAFSACLESLLFQRGAEAQKIIPLEICPIGTIDPLNSGIVLFGVERKQAHEMERVRMSSIERRGPLAANLRVQMPSSLHVVKFVSATV
jgi:hypothetical protein